MTSNKVKYFFESANAPAEVSDIITSLACGHVICVERLSNQLLPCMVLLTTIGLRSYQQQIVDDYEALLLRLEDVICHKEERDTLATSLDEAFVPEPWPWHPQLHLATSISLRGASGVYKLDEIPEARYIFEAYEELINAEPESYFPQSDKHAAPAATTRNAAKKDGRQPKSTRQVALAATKEAA